MHGRSAMFHFYCGSHRQFMVMRLELDRLHNPDQYCIDTLKDGKNELEMLNMIYGNFNYDVQSVSEFWNRIKLNG